MKNFFPVVLIFAVMYMFYFPIAYLEYARAEEREFSGLLLSKAVDYAGEAAFSACVETDDIELEYTDNGRMVFTPEPALNTFAAALCLSYDLPQTERNISEVVNKIPAMVFAAHDGYYVAETRETGNGEAALKWGLKRPYTVDLNPDSPNSGILYGAELGMKNITAVDKRTLAVTRLNSFPFSEETLLQSINRSVNRDINEALRRYAVSQNKPNMESFYLPVSRNTVGVRRIENPGLIVILRDLDIDGVRAVSLSSVNGMRAEQKRVIIAWTDGGGRKYYCYQGQADGAAQIWIEHSGRVFNTVTEAAQAGYAPY